MNLFRCFPGFIKELEKLAGVGSTLKSVGTKALETVSSEGAGHAAELGGLGVLAAPYIDNMVAKRRARKAGLADLDGYVSTRDADKYRLIKSKHHDAFEVGGLGTLAAPTIAGRLLGKTMKH